MTNKKPQRKEKKKRPAQWDALAQERSRFIGRRIEKFRRFCEAYWGLIKFEHGSWGNNSDRLDTWGGIRFAQQMFDPIALDKPENFWPLLQGFRQLAWDSAWSKREGKNIISELEFQTAWELLIDRVEGMFRPPDNIYPLGGEKQKQYERQAHERFTEMRTAWRRYTLEQQRINKQKLNDQRSLHSG